jgi:hypothetical protein
MARIIANPKRIEAHGTPPKTIEEYVGRVNTATDVISIARMVSPPGWSEPGQTPEFATVVTASRRTRSTPYKVAALVLLVCLLLGLGGAGTWWAWSGLKWHSGDDGTSRIGLRGRQTISSVHTTDVKRAF